MTLRKVTAALTSRLAQAENQTLELKRKCQELSQSKEMEEMAYHQAALARNKGRHKGPLPDRPVDPDEFQIDPDKLDFEGMTAVEVRARVAELKAVITRLRDSYPPLEQEAIEFENRTRQTRERTQRYRDRLKAMPRKFTDPYEEIEEERKRLREEKAQLEHERDAMKGRSETAAKELEKQEREARRELYNLEEEAALAEEDKDRWARRYKNEVERFESLKMEKNQLWHQIMKHFDHGIETVIFNGRYKIDKKEIIPAVQPYLFPDVIISDSLLDNMLEKLNLHEMNEFEFQDFCLLFEKLSEYE